MLVLLSLLACSGTATIDSANPSTAPAPVPWSGQLADLATDAGPIRQWLPYRAIMHLHSPWSHDACDGEPLVDGVPDPSCLADLRQALCDVHIDVAYLTDHPAHAADQHFEDLFHAQPQDERIRASEHLIATRLPCTDGHKVMWRAGIEDELMPLGLQAHSAPGDLAASDALYQQATPESISAHASAGAFVTIAHTEGKTAETIDALVAAGLDGMELFNLHAMFDPRKRSEDLGLDPMGWMSDIAPFTSQTGTGEPDLFFLAVLQEQAPSIARWDAAQRIANVVGFAGTDAHQNVLPINLRDGERGDSYRRMIRWFSNHLLIDGDVELPSPKDADQALAAGRLYTAFEILGTPAGLDFHLLGTDGSITEMGGTGAGHTLVVACPSLSPASPKNSTPPEVTATILKDGEVFAEGCGEHTVSAQGSYRLRVDMVPLHLRDFLGESPDEWLNSYPWVYTNPIRIQ